MNIKGMKNFCQITMSFFGLILKKNKLYLVNYGVWMPSRIRLTFFDYNLPNQDSKRENVTFQVYFLHGKKFWSLVPWSTGAQFNIAILMRSLESVKDQQILKKILASSTGKSLSEAIIPTSINPIICMTTDCSLNYKNSNCIFLLNQ